MALYAITDEARDQINALLKRLDMLLTTDTAPDQKNHRQDQERDRERLDALPEAKPAR